MTVRRSPTDVTERMVGAMAERFLGRLERLPKSAQATIVLAVFLSIVVLDVLTGAEATLRPLYLVPVATGSWLLGARFGCALGFLSATACVLFDLQSAFVLAHRKFLFTDGITRSVVYVVVSILVSRTRTLQAKLLDAALHDRLCAISNRRGFEHLAERELARARRAGCATTLVLIDVDGFKAINDARGHAEGDSALVAIAEVLGSGRATDLPARLGGDEFVVLLPETDAASARLVVEKLQARLGDAVRSKGFPITFSIGVATFPHVAPLAEMVREADARMYQTKRNGKNGATYGVCATG